MSETQNKSQNKSQEAQSDSLKLAILNAQLCDDKHGADTMIIDLQGVESSPANYFVLCSCESDAQVRAVADYIVRTARDYRLINPKVEGLETAEWVILDYFDVVVHIMHKELRDRYKIEKLWGDADFYSVNEDAEVSTISLDDVLNIYE